MISKHIASLGVEAEGGINEEGLDEVIEGLEKKNLRYYFQIHYDGSVSVPDKDYTDREFNFYNSNLKNIRFFLKLLFNAGFEANSTCGFHIHARITDNLPKLFSYEYFYNKFLELYKSRYKFNEKYLRRLRNSYCRAEYDEYKICKQLESRDKCHERYTAVNLNALNVHGTLEFRIFPYQESVLEAMSTIKFVINAVEKLASPVSCSLKNVSFNLDIPRLSYPKRHIIEVLKCAD
ncbi:MAG: hypothetical protein DRI44_05385 [Chlamydiae bacterium]|nr:MAG: hypothetical protein DRI44_05385 [Chlamydiota bacterium]